MENQIICPNCKKTITNNPIIDSAARKDGTGDESFNCDCGERITYWAITAQLRKQKTPLRKFQYWIKNNFMGKA